jgi:hypothetical protein
MEERVHQKNQLLNGVFVNELNSDISFHLNTIRLCFLRISEFV